MFLNYNEEKLWIGVCDNGPGLPKENKESLVEPYVTHKEKGTGLGLAIVKKIVEDHGGSLLFDPDPSTIDDALASMSGAHIFIALKRQENTV